MQKIVLFFWSFIATHSALPQGDAASQFLTGFAFRLAPGGVVLLRGTVGPFTDSLTFVLDTGCGGISLDSATMDRLHLPALPSNRILQTISGLQTIKMINGLTLHLPGLSVEHLNFYVSDYEMLSQVYGEKIDGLIGFALLRRFVIKLDFDNSIIEFWTPGSVTYPRRGFLSATGNGVIPSQALSIKEEKEVESRYLFDMGAGVNMLLSSDYVERESLFPKTKRMWSKSLFGADQKVNVKVCVVKQIKVGPYRLRDVPVCVFQDVNGIASNREMSGIVGNDLLRRFNLILNYPAGEIHLTPNYAFYDPFNYRYSGFEMYAVDGKILVGTVEEKSTAALAGLREGDEVVSVNSLSGGDLKTYLTVIQNETGKLTLLVRRGGQLQKIKFRLETLQ